ncbi:MAG: hypothetical protein ACRBN8_42000 [Nannocystales bacterium]
MDETPNSPESDRHPAFGSVVAGGGLIVFLLSGTAYVAATMLGIDALLMPAMIGMGTGVAWFVVSRLARVGHQL